MTTSTVHGQHVDTLTPHRDCPDCHAFAATVLDPELEAMADDDDRGRTIHSPRRPADAPRLGRFVLLDIREGRWGAKNTTPWSIAQIDEAIKVTMWRHRIERQRILGTCRQCGAAMSEDNPDGFVSMNHPSASDTSRCFTCEFWQGHAEDRSEDALRVVVNGHHFMIGEEPADMRRKSYLGHGGARFNIRFHDGREVVSHNLWSQGEITQAWRHRLPDNAVFVTASSTMEATG